MASWLPAPESVELGDQSEQAVGGGVQVGGKRRDLVAQIEQNVQFVVSRRIIGGSVAGNGVARRVLELDLGVAGLPDG